MSPLKSSIKRGALVTAANWHVVVVQFVADALFKTLLAVPIVGGVFLVVLLVGGEPSDLLERPVREILPAMATALLANPFALVSFLLALTLVVSVGSVLMFAVKAGTVSVLVGAERSAGPIEHPPLRLAAVRRVTYFNLERFTAGASHLFRRYLRLGIGLMIVYALSAIASFLLFFGPEPTSAGWARAAAAASFALVAWLTVVNFVYLLFQIAIAADDCSVRLAVGRVVQLLRQQTATIFLIFGATLAVVILATAASVLATAALGLIAFVPLIGLAALPLQLMAWVVRGLVFQYIGLTALVSYLRVYRLSREGTSPAALEMERTA